MIEVDSSQDEQAKTTVYTRLVLMPPSTSSPPFESLARDEVPGVERTFARALDPTILLALMSLALGLAGLALGRSIFLLIVAVIGLLH